MTTMTLSCLVKVLQRNFISHTYFCVIFRAGRWEAWSSMLSFSLGTSILTWCTMQLWWWHELRRRSIFSTTVSLVLQLWVLFLIPVIFLITSPYLLFIPLFIPPCTCRMRRQILTYAWHQHTPSSLILQSLPTRLWSVDFRIIFLCRESSVRSKVWTRPYMHPSGTLW